MIAFPPEISFYIQLVSFLLLWVALKKLLFEPVDKVLQERTQRTVGVRAEAAQMQHAAEVGAADYERRMQEVRRGISGDNDTERSRTEAEQRTLMTTAQTEAAALLASERASVQGQAAAARQALDARTKELSDLMLERVTGRNFA